MTDVALVAGTYQPEYCGVAHYTAHLRTALQEQGTQSTVLTSHAAAQTVHDPTVLGAVQGWQLTDLIPLVQAIRSTQADILHIQHAAGTYGFERAIFLLPLLLRVSGWQAPIVTTVHEYGWWEWQPTGIPPRLMECLKQWGQDRGWWDREDGFLLTLSNAIITTNTDAETVLYARLSHLTQRICRIPIAANIHVAPIDPTTAHLELCCACHWPEDAIVIVFFGFLHSTKGLETLLAAFKQVMVAQPRARLLLAGGVESLALPSQQATQYWNKLGALIDQLGLSGLVHRTGYLPTETASHYLTGSDIGVLPFNSGVTLKSGSLLAMLAHGLPVVATRKDPPDPALVDQHLLRLVAPRDIDQLATALIELVASPATQTQLRQAGCAFADNFTWRAIAKTHLEVYQNVLVHNPAAASG